MTVPLLTQRVYCVPRPGRIYRNLKHWLRSPVIDLDDAHDVLAEYGLQVEGKPKNLGGRRGNNLIIGTAAGAKMLKRYKGTVELDAVLCEHGVLSHLNTLNFPAPRLNRTLSGNTLVQKGNRYYALFDVLTGYFQYNNYFFLPSQLRNFIYVAGGALGSLHCALADFVPSTLHPLGFQANGGDRRRNLRWYLDRLDIVRQHLRETQTIDRKARAHIVENADWVEERLYALDDLLRAAALPKTIIHGDYGPYNLFFQSNGPVVILDFELTRLDWRLVDLASAVHAFARGRRGFAPWKMRAFIAGYRTHCAIDPDELALLPTVREYLMLRRLIICWQRYCESQDQVWLAEARQRLDTARALGGGRLSLYSSLLQ